MQQPPTPVPPEDRAVRAPEAPTDPQIDNPFEQISNAKLLKYLLLFALGWAIVQVLAFFETVLIIFIFAAILAFLLNYPVKLLQRFMPHSLAAILVFLTALVLVLALAVTLGVTAFAQAQELINQAPDIFQTVLPALERLENLLGNWNVQLDLAAIEEQVRNQALAGVGIGFATLQQILTNLLDLILIAVVAFFMLLDGKRIWRLVLKLFPRSNRPRITKTIQKNFLGFFWGRLILSAFFGVSCFVVFLLLGVPYTLILSAIAGIFDLIPGIGATLGISLVALIVLPQGIWLSIKVLIGCILLQQVEENLLMPRVMQGSINMNPVVMFFALLVGATAAGLVGVFLSIPVAGVVISLLEIDEMKGES